MKSFILNSGLVLSLTLISSHFSYAKEAVTVESTVTKQTATKYSEHTISSKTGKEVYIKISYKAEINPCHNLEAQGSMYEVLKPSHDEYDNRTFMVSFSTQVSKGRCEEVVPLVIPTGGAQLENTQQAVQETKLKERHPEENDKFSVPEKNIVTVSKTFRVTALPDGEFEETLPIRLTVLVPSQYSVSASTNAPKTTRKPPEYKKLYERVPTETKVDLEQTP